MPKHIPQDGDNEIEVLRFDSPKFREVLVDKSNILRKRISLGEKEVSNDKSELSAIEQILKEIDI